MRWWNDVLKTYEPRKSPTDMTIQYGGSFVDGSGSAQTTGDWNLSPDVSAVAGQPTKWWTGTTVVTLISQGAQDAMTAQELSDSRDDVADRVDEVEDIIRQVVVLVVDEINDHSLKINAILDAIDGANNLADVKTAIALITDLNPITVAQAKTKIRNGLGT